MSNEIKSKFIDRSKVVIALPEGRASEERNDCTVCALSNATGVDYSTARKIAWGAGRKTGKGFHTGVLVDFARTNHRMSFTDVDLTLGNPNKPKSMSVKRFIRKFPKGNFIVRVRGHALSVKDGVVVDSFTPKGLKRITAAWLFNGINA